MRVADAALDRGPAFPGNGTSGVRLCDAIAVLLLLACLSSVTSEIPVSPVFVGAAFAVALARYARSVVAIPAYTRWCALYFVFITGSAILSGVPLREFANYEFYRYDGNVYVSFLPFLLAPALMGHRLSLRVSLPFLVLGASIFICLAEVASPGDLFRSHNALGGFVSVMLIINLVLLRRVVMWPALLLNLWILQFSQSRGSLLGVLLAIFTLFLYKRGWRKTALAAPLLAIAGSLAIAGFGYRVWANIGKPQILDISQFSEGISLAQGIDTGSISVSSVTGFGDRGATIAHRIFFIWPAAVDDFLASPVLGVGFSRFDDRPQDLHGVRGVLMLNETPDILHTNLHAHNSYLQVASETGIVGLLFVAGILVTLWRSAGALERPYDDIVRGLLLYVLYSSCTEQRLTTPAQMIPAASMIVILLTSRFARGASASEAGAG